MRAGTAPGLAAEALRPPDRTSLHLGAERQASQHLHRLVSVDQHINDAADPAWLARRRRRLLKFHSGCVRLDRHQGRNLIGRSTAAGSSLKKR